MDEVCLLSGVPYLIGGLIYDESIPSEDAADDLLQRAGEHHPELVPDADDPLYDTWLTRLQEVLDMAPGIMENDPTIEFFKGPVLVIGHFLEEFGGDVPSRYVLDPGTGQYKRRILSGKGVQMKEVSFLHGERIEEYVEDTGEWVDVTGGIRTSCSTQRFPKLDESGEDGFGNFWIFKNCLRYLQAWIRLPGTTNGLYDPPLSFIEEFYEVVNSRRRGLAPYLGSFEEMDYDGTDATIIQNNWQFQHGFEKGTRLVSELCDDSAGPYQLLEALFGDCGYWKVMSPTGWPRDQSRANPTTPDDPKMLRLGPPSNIQRPSDAPFTKLPVELIELIATKVDTLADFFSFAHTSTSLYNALTDPTRLKSVYKEMASSPSGCLFWIRPIPDDEDDLHSSGVQRWFPDQDLPRAHKDPFDHPGLPLIPFIRECYLSNSMRNRRRLWRQVKQIEGMWKDYRMNGWQVNRFITLDQADQALCDH